jgi:hypothetical protein
MATFCTRPRLRTSTGAGIPQTPLPTTGIAASHLYRGGTVDPGSVRSEGALHLNGQVQGEVHCGSLVLGEKARLEGSVVAEDVVIGGRLV